MTRTLSRARWRLNHGGTEARRGGREIACYLVFAAGSALSVDFSAVLSFALVGSSSGAPNLSAAFLAAAARSAGSLACSFGSGLAGGGGALLPQLAALANSIHIVTSA